MYRVHDENDRFHDQRQLGNAKCRSHGPVVCADAQCCKITWLEELVSKSNTIQTQEDISVAGKIAGNIQAKLYINL